MAIYKGKNNPNWKGGKIKKICFYCQKMYFIFPYQKNVSKTCGKKFCRKKHLQTFTGIKSNFWKGGKKIKKRCKICNKIIFSFECFNRKFCSQECVGRFKRTLIGSKSPNWNGGLTELVFMIRHNILSKKWRNKVFERDKFTCQWCRDNKGRNLEADHIKPISFLIKNYKIKTLKQALSCKELWDISNGRTLCQSCHKKTDTYGRKAKVYQENNTELIA